MNDHGATDQRRVPGEPDSDGAAEGPCPVLDADRAFLLSVEAWGGESRESLLDRLQPSWRERIRRSLLRSNSEGESPRELLRRSHRFQIAAAPERVHPSWIARALQDESPAVRAFLAGHGPEAVRAISTRAGRQDGAPEEDHGPDPAAAAWVVALWAERLVGGEPVQEDEPPAVLAIATLSPRDLYRLCHATGQSKAVLAGDLDCIGGMDPEEIREVLAVRDRLRVDSVRPPGETPVEDWARREWSDLRGAEVLRLRRRLAYHGLVTLARLLSGCEPYRLRWVLQLLPYPLAKRLRSLMAAPDPGASVRHREAILFQAASSRLAPRGIAPRGFAGSAARDEHAP